MPEVDLSEALKLKDKLTLITLNTGFPVSTKRLLVVKAVGYPHKGSRAVVYSEAKKRKTYALDPTLAMYTEETCYMLLRGHATGVFVDSDSKTGWVGSGTLNLWNPHGDATREAALEIIECIKAALVCCSLGDISVHLYDKTREHKLDITREMRRSLPQHSLTGWSQPPERKLWPDPIPDSMKALMRAEEDRVQASDGELHYGKPFCKMFRPGTTATWLCYSMEDDMDTMWVVADLGLDCVEFGTLSLKEVRQHITGTSCGPELDKFFDPEKCPYSIGDLTQLSRLPDNLHEK